MHESRYWFAAGLVLACLLPMRQGYAAEVADGLESTRNLAQAGAPQLALRRIESLQPADAAAPRWADWERLRLQLLANAGRNDELLMRATGWPAGLPELAGAELHAIAAEAALALGRGAAVRELSGRALWVPGISATLIRELRLLVIRSYVRESRADDAYRSMLRFQQDYQPLDVATATGFVNDLLDIGQVKEAVTWLGLLEERGAVKLRLRLHTGLVTPQDALIQARAGLSRSEELQWWRVLMEAAVRLQSGAQRIEALEQLLNAKGGSAPDPRVLWEAYVDYARQAANTHQLLAGDDVNWLEFAMRRGNAEPVIARAYFAFLARHARAAPERQRAQALLAENFAAARLNRTALRIYDIWPGDPAALTAPTRYALGTLAEAVSDHERAWLYWQGLSAPEGVPATGWDLRLAALALRAGAAGAATQIGRQLVVSPRPIPAAQLPEWIMLAQQFADHGLTDGAQALFERTLPHTDATQARLVLAGIARLHEARNQPLLAADYYLRAALRASGPDAAAAEARLQAGLSLARAGLREDARAQFEWLLKHARDPAQIAVARRELGF